MKLSNRLYAVASLVETKETIADIGTDHAYIPIYLIKEKKIKHAIAMDIHRGPLMRAKEHVAFEGVSKEIQLRLSDGADKLEKNEVQAVIIAGMGGNLVIHILEQGKEVLRTTEELILQPQSEIERVRTYLHKHGYTITKEEMVYEDGKFYPMMRVICKQDERTYRKMDDVYGYFLIKQKHPVLAQFLAKEEQQYKEIFQHVKDLSNNETQKDRLMELEQKIKLIEQVRMEMVENEM